MAVHVPGAKTFASWAWYLPSLLKVPDRPPFMLTLICWITAGKLSNFHSNHNSSTVPTISCDKSSDQVFLNGSLSSQWKDNSLVHHTQDSILFPCYHPQWNNSCPPPVYIQLDLERILVTHGLQTSVSYQNCITLNNSQMITKHFSTDCLPFMIFLIASFWW